MKKSYWSVVATYWTMEEANKNRELMESGDHPDFFGGGIYDIHCFNLPQPPKAESE